MGPCPFVFWRGEDPESEAALWDNQYHLSKIQQAREDPTKLYTVFNGGFFGPTLGASPTWSMQAEAFVVCCWEAGRARVEKDKEDPGGQGWRGLVARWLLMGACCLNEAMHPNSVTTPPHKWDIETLCGGLVAATAQLDTKEDVLCMCTTWRLYVVDMHASLGHIMRYMTPGILERVAADADKRWPGVPMLSGVLQFV